MASQRYKALFIVQHRKDRSPGQRFRHEQYLDYLEANGFDITYSPLVDANEDKVLYSPGNYLAKAKILFNGYRKRWRDVGRAHESDVIFLYREALMTGSTYFEKRFAKTRAKMIFDFDDSIWIPSVSEANRALSFLKRPEKTGEIIALSDLIIAGNDYLADYARQFNPNVRVIPTTIDTDEYQPVPNQRSSDYLTIGWSGSVTTIQHFEHALPFLRPLKQKFGDRVRIKVIGDSNYRNEELGIQGLAWSKEAELRELSSFDIGIMPLPDDPWAKGKCGLKGLQYMALEIPTLMSPVGVNADIIQDGVNGYLATEVDEWVQKIEHLIQNPEARLAMGRAGRQTVLDQYSVHANREKYLDAFRSLV